MMYSRMVEPIGAVMQRKMLKEIKKLAEKIRLKQRRIVDNRACDC
jgi:hypothetical protein